MTRIVAGTAWLALVLAVCRHDAQAQSSAPSPDDMIKALTRDRTAGTEGFRLNPHPGAASPDAPGPAHAHHAGAVPRASDRQEIGVPLLFDLDSATLKPESGPALANIVQALNDPRLVDKRILIEGHTDASGGAAHNLILSQQRALAVKAALAQQGVDAARLTTAGRGQSDPANPRDPMAAENRRVILVNASG